MDYKEYRESVSEKNRTKDLMRLVRKASENGEIVLDIGARDGHFSILLSDVFTNVIALDLEKPLIKHERIQCVQGNIINMEFDDNSFGLVFCAEVLEHIPKHLLEKACSELSRVTDDFLLIGVPYKQDLRVGRTTCYTCDKKNPPWGHVNRFDLKYLKKLFPSFNVLEKSFVGETNNSTNAISTFLMDLAGNPYGSYAQEEPCIYCGNTLKNPPERNLLQKLFTKGAFYTNRIQRPFIKPRPSWIHILMQKLK